MRDKEKPREDDGANVRYASLSRDKRAKKGNLQKTLASSVWLSFQRVSFMTARGV